MLRIKLLRMFCTFKSFGMEETFEMFTVFAYFTLNK